MKNFAWSGFALLTASLATSPAHAATAAVYADPSFVNSASLAGAQGLLQQFGYSVTTFAGTSAASMAPALSANLIVFPGWTDVYSYQQQGGFSEATRLSLVSYIGEGGGVLWIGDGARESLAKTMFGENTTILGGTGTEKEIQRNPSISSELLSPYFTAPLTLGRPTPINDAINPYTFTGVIENVHDSRYLYSDLDEGVLAMRFANGAGKVGYLAWNYDGATAVGGAPQDGGWNQVFGLVANDLAAVPEPGTYALLALGLGALTMVAGKRKLPTT